MKKNIEIEEAFKIFESSVKDIGIEKLVYLRVWDIYWQKIYSLL